MSEPWTTIDEKRWIDTMGQHDQSIKKVPYIELLERYLEAAKKRKSWDGIDKRTVIAYAKKQLRIQDIVNTLL
jgi:hypothetical protein